MKFLATISAAVVALTVAASASAAIDVKAAKKIYKSPKNNCYKCHSLTKEKDGPSYHKVAEKYKGNPDAVEKLIHHITSGEMAKFPDGHKEKHKIVHEKDPEQLKNLVEWILSQ